MIETKNPGIQEAIREIKRMSLSNPLRLRYEAYLKRVRDEKARELYVRNEGRAEGKAESVLLLLADKGSIPSKLSERIREETDSEILDKWLRLASRAESLEMFEQEM